MKTPSDKFSKFRATLMAQRQQLVADLRAKAAANSEALGDRSKLAEDEALAEEATELELAMAIHENAELRDIDAALARIDDGSYGSCVDCDSAISQARLTAYPTAKRCLECQQERERALARASGMRH